MIKKIFLMLAAAAMSYSPAFAQIDFDRGTADLGGLIAASAAPAVQAPAPDKSWWNNNNNSGPAQLKEWTVMVYVNGKNDLEVAGLYNINKMELAGSNDSLNIVTEIGRMNGQQNDVSFDGNWTGSRRYYVTQDSNEEKIKSKLLQSFDSVDMGDWKHLADFAKWAKTNYPARRYALIIWNHGSGWVTSKGLPQNKGISYDFETKNHISTPELGMAMKEIGKVDILGFDACLMQMAEVVYETKDFADYVVGSEETVPGYGFPYDVVLRSFAPSRSTEELAKTMVSAYDSFYSSKGKKVTLSAVKVSELGGFMAAFNGWTEALLASDKKPELKKRMMLSASYADKDNKDLYDFAGRLAADYPQDPVGVKSAELMSAMTGKLVVSNAAYKESYGRDDTAHGLALYMPNSGYNAKYDSLAWARDTKWDDFLKVMQDVSAPGLEFMNGCKDPGPGASLDQLMAYVDCLTNALNNLK